MSHTEYCRTFAAEIHKLQEIMAIFDVETAQNVEISRKIPCEKPLMQQLPVHISPPSGSPTCSPATRTTGARPSAANTKEVEREKWKEEREMFGGLENNHYFCKKM